MIDTARIGDIARNPAATAAQQGVRRQLRNFARIADTRTSPAPTGRRKHFTKLSVHKMGNHMSTSSLPRSSNAPSFASQVVPAHSAPEHSHGVCWAAIFAGAAGAAVLSLVLLVLGTGIGFSAISPWSNQGVSATTVSVSTIIWMSVVQILASILGGYLAGRLRTKWVSLHSHETYFRDTAHGFLAWAVATLLTASLLSSAVGSIVSGGAATIVGAGAAVMAGSTISGSAENDSLSYFTDSLFRPGAGQTPTSPSGATSPNPSAEVGRIFAMGIKNGSLSPADSQYLAQLVAQRTGLSANDAQKRVSDTFAQIQQSIQEAKAQAQAAADAARKASAALALWLVVSLLLGAFAASWAATFGGRLRDGLDTTGARSTNPI